jgi:MYXO-CTERM domain-containing protein
MNFARGVRGIRGLLTLTVVAAAVLPAPPVDACGGFFTEPSETVSQVTGNRIVLSLGMDQTTLYSQIEYSGDPASFAWVLPIKGQADVGLSADGMLNALDAVTAVELSAPPFSCPSHSCEATATGAGGSAGTASSSGGGVDVLAQEVVGPFETVQLASTDPNALTDWLTGHGYTIPADIQPVVSAYVNEGFDFLAMKLVPGQSVSAIRPVRVTTSGASPGLPLRMMAAGAGDTTVVTLWVVSEGRYEPQNFPSFTVDRSALVWDWDSSSSNYSALVQAGYDAQLAYDPRGAGYGDGDPTAAQTELDEDLDTLFTGLSAPPYITRLRAELSRAALATDLVLQASSDQSPLSNHINVTNTVGTPPACPPPPDCDDSSCAFEQPGSSASGSVGALLLTLVGAGALVSRRRRHRSKRS